MKRFLARTALLLALAFLALTGKPGHAQEEQRTPADLIKIIEDEMLRRGLPIAGLTWWVDPDRASADRWTFHTQSRQTVSGEVTSLAQLADLKLGGGYFASISKTDRRIIDLIGQR